MAEFTEQQVYEALGLGAQAQEIAEPAPEPQETEGAQAQEIAEPAQPKDSTEEPADTGSEDPQSGERSEAEDGGKEPLTPEQRRANAARRRAEEQQAAIQRAVNEALNQQKAKNDAAMQDFFRRAGLKNTVTGAPITNMEEFEAWNQQYADAKLQQDLKAGKLTPEGLAAAIGKNPTVQQAQQLIDRDNAARKQQADASARSRIDGEIAEIHKMDESISTLEDLMKSPSWPQIYQRTRRGYSIRDAYYLENGERLEKAKIEAAKQQSLNNARGKDHMTGGPSPRGGGSISVPAADLALFRQFNPNATDAQIQAYYNKYKNG